MDDTETDGIFTTKLKKTMKTRIDIIIGTTNSDWSSWRLLVQLSVAMETDGT